MKQTTAANRRATILIYAAAWVAGQVPVPASWAAEAAAAELEEVVVTARRREENLQKVPESVTVLSRSVIENAGIDSYHDFAAITPNFTFDQRFRPGVGIITVRGISTPQGGEPPVTIVEDGIQAAGLDFINQGLYDIESIQVLRGPQGALYGRGAIGGALLISTRQPTDKWEGRFKASYGNDDHIVLGGAFSGPLIKDRLLFRLAASYEDSDGHINHATLSDGADFIDGKYSVRGRIVAHLSEDLSLDLRFSRLEGEIGASPYELVTAGQTTDFSVLPDGNLVTSDQHDITEFSGKLDYQLPLGTLSLTGSRSLSDSLVRGEADFTTQTLVRQNTDVSVSSWNGNALFTSRADRPFRWQAGGFYQHREDDDILVIDGDPGGFLSGITIFQSHGVEESDAWAVYGQINYDLLSNAELSVALRYDEDARTALELLPIASGPDVRAEKTFSKWQPKASLAYYWTEDLTTYISWGRGFRSGGFNDFASALNPIVDRQYKAETSESVEIGVKAELAAGRLSLNVAAFHIDLDHQQFFFLDSVSFARSIVNINSSEIFGVEIEAFARPLPGLDLNLGFGLADNRIDDFDGSGTFENNAAPQGPLYTFNLGLQYTHPLRGVANAQLVGRMDYERRGRRYFDLANSFGQGDIDIVNLRGGIKAGRWSVMAFAKNLNDEEFIEDFAEGFPPAFAPAFNGRLRNRPRYFGVEVGVDFE